MDSLGFIKHKSGWAALPWPGCRNEDCVFVPPFEEEITFPLVPLWLMAVGCCAHRKGRCPLIQTIWAGSVVRHRLSNILWLNQFPDDCSFVDGGVALIGGDGRRFCDCAGKKIKHWDRRFYCCIIIAVIFGLWPSHHSYLTFTEHRSLRLQTFPLIIPRCCSVAMKICLMTTFAPTACLMPSKDHS